MTKDDIIQMAREADLYIGTNACGIPLVGHRCPGQETGLNHITLKELERFAVLVAAAEREACAKIAESFDPYSRWTNMFIHISDKIRARSVEE